MYTISDCPFEEHVLFHLTYCYSPDRRFLSNQQVKQFATWLEIDKTEELLATQENVFGR